MDCEIKAWMRESDSASIDKPTPTERTMMPTHLVPISLTKARRQAVMMNTTVSIVAEIPEELHETLGGYLETHPDWDQDRVFAAALSLFLLQNGDCDRRAARVYLNTLFQHNP